MLAVSTINTISSIISKSLCDNAVSDEEYSLILLEFETFTRMKEDIRIKSKTSLEKSGNIETEASVQFKRNTTTTAWTHIQNHVQNHVQNCVENSVQNCVQNHFQILVQNYVQNHVQNCDQNSVQNCVKNHVQNSVQNHVRKIKR